MDLKEYMKNIKKEKIWDIVTIGSTDEQPLLFFNIGEPHLRFYLREKDDETDRYYFKRFKRMMKSEQKYYHAVMESPYRITTCGEWKLKFNDEILLDSKNKQKLDDDYFQERFLFLFAGQKVINIKLIDENINIYFSNKMVITIYRKKNKDGIVVLDFRDNKTSTVLSIEEGLVENFRKYCEMVEKKGL